MTALDWLVRTSWQAGALVLVILLARLVLGRRLSPRWRYRLWWLVVARLLLPPVSVPGFHLPAEEPAPAIVSPLALVSGPPAPAAPDPDTPAEPRNTRAVDAPPPAPRPAMPPGPVATRPAAPDLGAFVEPAARDAAPAGLPLAAVLTGLWLAGALLFAALAVVRELRLLRRVGADPPHDDPRVIDLVERCRREAGIRRPVAVVRSRAVSVPAVVGILRPRLLLPDAAVAGLPPAGLRDVVLHEMEHVRHHDGAVNWLLNAVLSLHWPNPLVRLATARLRADREAVRDLGALARFPSRNARDYGRTILAVASSARPIARPVAVAILEPGGDVRRRITMVLGSAGRPARGAVTGGTLALLLFALTLFFASEPAPAEEAPAAPAAAPRAPVLVTGFSVTGDLLAREAGLAGSLEVLTEALLAERFAPVSGAGVAAACDALGADPGEIASSPDLRLAVSKRLGVAACVTGWAASFGERVVLILEVIDPARGLPGAVHRQACDGVEGIPEALETLLARALAAAPEEVVEEPAPAEPAPVEAEAKRPEPTIEVTVAFPPLPESDLLETWPNDAWRRLVELREKWGRWAPPEVVREAERLLENVAAHLWRLESDPTYHAEYVLRTNVRRDPVLSELDFEVVSRRPWVLFVERLRPGASSAAAAGYAAKLGRLYGEFRERFADEKPLPESDAGLLRAFVFTQPESFESYQETVRQPLPFPVHAYYARSTRRLVVNAAGAGEYTSTWLVHEAFHQLRHAYATAALGERLGEEVLFTDARTRSDSLWLEEGLAELFAGASAAPGEEWDFAARIPFQVEELRRTNCEKRPDWSLEELLRVRDIGELRRRAAKKGLGDTNRLTSLFWAQAWGFCHFLWNHEEGRHRERLVEAFRADLRGETGYDAVREVFGETDVRALETEWRAWTSTLGG